MLQEQLVVTRGRGRWDIGSLEDCILRLFIALVSELLDQRRREEGGVLGGVHFGLVDRKKHLLNPFLGVTDATLYGWASLSH